MAIIALLGLVWRLVQFFDMQESSGMMDGNNKDALLFNSIDQSVVAVDKLTVSIGVVLGKKPAY
jgi:hypothetical protein